MMNMTHVAKETPSIPMVFARRCCATVENTPSVTAVHPKTVLVA
jgi:hypothetical protein